MEKFIFGWKRSVNKSKKRPKKFRAEKRSAQASAHLLSQAQGGLFCVGFWTTSADHRARGNALVLSSSGDLPAF